MVQLREQRPAVREFHNFAQIHDRDAMGQVLHRRQIMTDEQQRQTELVLQIDKKIDDLCLDRNIQSRHRFIANDQIRARRQRPSDADPLPLATGEFVREPVDGVPRKTDLVHQRRDLFGQVLAAVRHPKIDQRLSQNVAHLHPRIEAAKWVLEHHLHPLAHHTQLARRHVVDALAVQIDLAVRQPEQPQDRLANGRFAAAGFADERQCLASVDGKRYSIDGIDLSSHSSKQAATNWKMLLENIDLKQRTLGGHIAAFGPA